MRHQPEQCAPGHNGDTCSSVRPLHADVCSPHPAALWSDLHQGRPGLGDGLSRPGRGGRQPGHRRIIGITRPCSNAYRGWNARRPNGHHVYNWFDAFGRNTVDTDRLRPRRPDPLRRSQPRHAHCGHDGRRCRPPTAAPSSAWRRAPNGSAAATCADGIGTPATTPTCFEFFLAPYPQGGRSRDRRQARAWPRMSSTTRGAARPSEGCDADSLRQVVDTRPRRRHLIVASAGNSGPGCSTDQDPLAIYDAVLFASAPIRAPAPSPLSAAAARSPSTAATGASPT